MAFDSDNANFLYKQSEWDQLRVPGIGEPGYTRVARGENGANCTPRSSFPSKLVTSIFRRIVVADYPALLRLSAAAEFNYDSKNFSFSILMENFVLPAFQKIYRGNPNIAIAAIFVVVFVFNGKKVSRF